MNLLWSDRQMAGSSDHPWIEATGAQPYASRDEIFWWKQQSEVGLPLSNLEREVHYLIVLGKAEWIKLCRVISRLYVQGNCTLTQWSSPLNYLIDIYCQGIWGISNIFKAENTDSRCSKDCI